VREAIDPVNVSPRASFGIFLLALFLLLAIMSYQITDGKTGRTVLGAVLFRIFSPVQLFAHSGTSGISDAVRTYFSLVETNKENAVLRKEVSELRIKLATVGEQTRENERLRKILDLHDKVQYELIVGEIVGRDAKSPVSDTIVVNRGTRQGIKREMPVVTPDGIVGITMNADVLTSKVQLITDASASVGAMLASSRVAGILSGLGGGRCVLHYLPLNAIFKKGDLVNTSGQDGIFPIGLPIGRVTTQINESSLYKSVEIAPFPNFSSLEEVVFLSAHVPVNTTSDASVTQDK
jgi:rod shape-determining protein MreC